MIRALFPCTLTLIATATLFGCAPELGDTPFLCNRGLPTCPEGYICQPDLDGSHPGFCVKEGFTPLDAKSSEASIDATSVDSGPSPDNLPSPDTESAAPLVVITEFMADPDAVGDESGEWFEVHNGGNIPLDLQGWTIKDEGSESHRIATSLQIPAKGFIVLAASGQAALNGGINAAYAYGYDNFRLSNTADAIILLDDADREVDRVSYSITEDFLITPGASLSVKDAFGDKSQASAWCTETRPWGGSSGDLGTPGSSPGCR
ncbi:MAG: lamin tail domain-containing protein [Deltaproteobacteria bacterium]|nr:lamin tail domain-containing protein [Deltaproteobacteria bacterium]